MISLRLNQIVNPWHWFHKLQVLEIEDLTSIYNQDWALISIEGDLQLESFSSIILRWNQIDETFDCVCWVHTSEWWLHN